MTKPAGLPQCAAIIPDAGQANVARPITKRCSYRARPGETLCPVHLKHPPKGRITLDELVREYRAALGDE